MEKPPPPLVNNIILQTPSLSSVFLIIALVLLIILIVKSTKSRTSKKEHYQLPPGRYGWPVFGETREFLRAGLEGKPEEFVKSRMEKYGSKIFKTSLLGESMAVVGGTAGNKFLFGNENKLVTVWWPSSVRKLLGPCLSTTVGEEAKQMRKMLSYFVGPDALGRLYIKDMDLVTRQHLDTHWQGKDEVKVFPTIKLYTFELACRLFMSLEDQNQIEKLASLFNIFLKGIISLAINLPGTRFYHALRATNAIREVLLKILRERKVALSRQEARNQLNATSSSSNYSRDLLSHLLLFPDDNGKFMSETLIVNNILMLLFAGHDTSSVAITLLMKTLAELPHVHEKVLQEQMEIASSKGEDEDALLQWDDIQKMRYSWNVVSEAMRLSPPILGAFREALVDLNIDGYDIPKGWKLYWSAVSTHRDPSLFPDAAKFEPSRYEGAGPIPYSYVAFGGGPRMCLGKEYARLEILVFLHNVMRRFRWSLADPDEKIEFDAMPTPVKGLPIKLLPL